VSPDPFDLLRDELVAAAAPAGVRARRRVRSLVVVAAALALSGTATAAVLSLTGGQPSAPLRGALPGERGPSARNYTISLTPNLFPGQAGWCRRVALRRGRAPVTGGMGCGLAAASGTALIAGGAMSVGSDRILAYAVVDRRVASVELAPGLRVAPRAEPTLPFGWRAAVAFVPTRRGALPGEATILRLFDARGRAIDRSPEQHAGTRALPTRKVDPLHPPAVPCAITHAPIAHLRHVSQTIVRGLLATRADVNGRALRTCSEAAFSLGTHRLRAAVLVDAAGPRHEPPPLPGAMTARRIGRAWLVVDGGTPRDRRTLLAALHVRHHPTR
jgi:hypothetical protein